MLKISIPKLIRLLPVLGILCTRQVGSLPGFKKLHTWPGRLSIPRLITRLISGPFSQ